VTTALRGIQGSKTTVPTKLPRRVLDVGMFSEDDPTQWNYDGTGDGIYYRSPTSKEMSEYRWTVDHLLVIFEDDEFIDDVVSAEASTRLTLPIHDNDQGRPQIGLEVSTIALTRQYSHSAIPYLETTVGTSGIVGHRTLFPTVSMYLPTSIAWDAIPDRVAAVTSSSRGGISVHGGSELDRFWIRGPFSDGDIYTLELAPPIAGKFFIQRTVHDTLSASLTLGKPLANSIAPLIAQVRTADSFTSAPHIVASQIRFGQCNDSLDNDHDTTADNCDYNCVVHKDFGGSIHDYEMHFEYSKDYAITGDLKFCIKHPSPETEIDLIAAAASSILNNVQPTGAYALPVRAPPFRMPMRGCFEWAGADNADIDACHDDATNCPPGLDYPFGGTLTSALSLYSRAWDALEANIVGKSPDGIRPVHIAVVLTARLIGVNGATFGFQATEPASQRKHRGVG